MLNRIRRWILALQIYAIDIEIDRYTKALETNLAAELRRCIESSREFARAERARLCSLHSATYPIGQRHIYDGF